ncbi:hypothetical protein NMY22_g12289 [Coprinellus aureogranulatus]|nr:hypothetical protein NMY22_g12289 [Coprinellus aureogranulatus]
MSDDEEQSGWQLTESDPGVFTELLKTLGVPLIVDDLYSLDSETLAALKPIHALIFLFKWVASGDSSTHPGSSAGTYDSDFPGFFAHQVVNNACATLAVLNGIGNIPALPTGSQLSELLSFTTGMDPQTRGLVVTSADWLREAHNSLSPPSAISLEGLNLPKKTEDAYHFVVYLPYMGAVYELDGLKPHAVRHGAYSDHGSLEFSLLALRDDPLPSLQSQIQKAQQAGNKEMEHHLLAALDNENAKRERWAFENSLRRHNHVGLVHGLLKVLAKSGNLSQAEVKAKEAMRKRIEQRRARGEDMDDD